MDSVGLSAANQVYLNNNANQPVTNSVETASKPEMKADGDDKLKKALACLALAGVAIAAGVVIHNCGSAKKVQTVANDAKEQATKLLSDIDFNKGSAKLKGTGEQFTGVIQDTLKNGDKITMEYTNGVLQKSTREGSKSFEKVYQTLQDGTHKVTTTQNGKTTSVVIEDLQNAAKKSQEDLKQIMAKKDELSAEDFQKQTDAIKHKNKAQKEEIQNTIKDKQAKEAQVKAEKAKAEAEAKAKAEAEAKAKAEAEAEAKAEEARKAEEAKKAEQARQTEQRELQRYQDLVQEMEKNRVISQKVDALLADPEFEKKFDKFLHTPVTIQKSHYDCTMIETTLDEAMTGTIKGTYSKTPSTIYHGTNKHSYKDIMKKGFSLETCSHCESGKGIYFGLEKAGAEKYSRSGSVIQAKYTGGKIANVKPGVVGDLSVQHEVARTARNVLGIGDPLCNDEERGILKELISRAYTNKLKSMGYDAVHTGSIGAGCEYITVLDPKHIKIMK